MSRTRNATVNTEQSPVAVTSQDVPAVTTVDVSTMTPAELLAYAQARVAAETAARREVSPVFTKRPVPAFLLAQARQDMQTARDAKTPAETRREYAASLSGDVQKLAAIGTMVGNWLAGIVKPSGRLFNARAAHSRYVMALDAMRNASSLAEYQHSEQTVRERFHTMARHLPGLGAVKVPGSDATVKPANEELQVLRTIRALAPAFIALPLATLSDEERATIAAEDAKRRETRLARLAETDRAIAATLTGIVVDAEAPAIAAPASDISE